MKLLCGFYNLTYFRAARSCSFSHSTQVNFSLKEFLCSRCRKIDASLRLTASGVKNGLIYPRCKRPFDSSLEFTENLSENSFGIGESSRVFIPKALPSLEEIEVTILKARADAVKELATLRIYH